jgi:hypothetical protein
VLGHFVLVVVVVISVEGTESIGIPKPLVLLKIGKIVRQNLRAKIIGDL